MIPSDQPHLRVTAKSHPGKVRDHNEDSYGVTAHRLEHDGRPSVLAIVADGIGGHQAGEVASAITVDTIFSLVEATDGEDPQRILGSAVVEAAKRVHQAASQDEARKGMGSTVAIAWVLGSQLYTTYVGDSRIYLRHDGILRQTSVDHTWIQEALEHDVIQPDEVAGHPNAHVLRRHIGGEKPPEPDFRLRMSEDETAEQSVANQGLSLHPGDQILLCTDGLTDLLDLEDIDSALLEHGSEATTSLVWVALQRGGHDNVTVVVMEVPQDPRPSSSA